MAGWKLQQKRFGNGLTVVKPLTLPPAPLPPFLICSLDLHVFLHPLRKYLLSGLPCCWQNYLPIIFKRLISYFSIWAHLLIACTQLLDGII